MFRANVPAKDGKMTKLVYRRKDDRTIVESSTQQLLFNIINLPERLTANFSPSRLFPAARTIVRGYARA